MLFIIGVHDLFQGRTGLLVNASNSQRVLPHLEARFALRDHATGAIDARPRVHGTLKAKTDYWLSFAP
jgi:hypothetical protein